MENLSHQDIEKMTGSKYVTTRTIDVKDPLFGDEETHRMKFDIFDGFAYCPDYEGEEYYMCFPKKEFIKLAKTMEESIREFTQIPDDQEITEIEIMISYNTLFKNSK